MQNWTDPQEVIDAWIGNDAPTNVAQVARYVAKAERHIRLKVPGIDKRLEARTEPDLKGTITDVVTSMVHRVFRNPEGIRQVQTSTGPFSGSRTYGGDTPGEMSLTDDELESLSGGSRKRAFSIDTLAKSGEQHPLFGVMVNGPGDWAPWSDS